MNLSCGNTGRVGAFKTRTMRRKTIAVIYMLSLVLLTFPGNGLRAQSNEELREQIEQLNRQVSNMRHSFDMLNKRIDDVLWMQKLEDVAWVDKVYIYGPPLWQEEGYSGMGIGNPVKFWTYVIIPKNTDPAKKYPLMVLPHGGVHADFTTYYTHIVRELVAQGYIIVAAEYRGSTGYGKAHYEKIDYGGREVEDVKASRDYMIENFAMVDEKRVGIMGWSHGGLITLMNIFDYPDDYQVAFAGVPVSDLVARMGYADQSYRDLYSADYHIGQTANENVDEYRRRSPAWNAHKMKDTPLLIHTNTNDEDVNVLEVEHLIKSLKAEDKAFEYEIYQALPGGHSFDRMDTRKANEIRVKIYKFLAKELDPPHPIGDVRTLKKAAYRY